MSHELPERNERLHELARNESVVCYNSSIMVSSFAHQQQGRVAGVVHHFKYHFASKDRDFRKYVDQTQKDAD
ncbi:hypothetical protein BQ1740_3667 [Bacillus subtilis]|nr:hypothetical protein BQ1740_3667 [Bacillus subtilis]